MPRTPDLSSVYLKLERAEKHIETVRKKTTAFRESDPPPFGVRTEEAPRPGKAVKYVLYAIVREKPPRRLALPIGDAIQNMRAALDHLVYELATPKGRASTRLQFPIFKDECFFRVNGPGQIPTIKGKERTLIERVQPYNASDPARYDPLAILQELSNLDKHRLLIPMVAAVSETDSWIASDNAAFEWHHFEGGAVEDGTEIMAFTARPKDPAVDMHVYPKSGLEIQLTETGADDLDIEVIDLLGMLHHHIRHMVIDQWFVYGHMPLTVAELRKSQTPP